MLYTQPLAMIRCEWQFLAVMIAAIVKTQRHSDRVGIVVEHGNGVHTAG